MKKTAVSLAIAAALPALASADTFTFYGKANVDFQSADEGDGATTDIESNASRLGAKGELPFDSGVKGIYKLEYGVDIDGDSEETLKRRNLYAGLEGGFGQVIAGRFDTPMRLAQKKVDLFNDLEGDIGSVITRSENRESGHVQYTTPAFSGFTLAASHIGHRDEVIGQDQLGRDITRDNGTSMSLAYDKNGIYLAYGIDRDVEANDWNVQRLAGQYNTGPVQVGALFEEQEKADGSTQDGWMASAAYNINRWTAKAQYGQSDVVVADAETYSLGLDYKLSSAAKVFGFYTDETAADDYDRSYFGIGTEFKF